MYYRTSPPLTMPRQRVKRHGNLWPDITSSENIREAYLSARRGKSKLQSVQRFEKNEWRNLVRVRMGLLEKSFRTAYYSTKVIKEPKERTIYILPFYPDRIVQHALMRVLRPIWDGLLLDCCHSCRNDRGIVTGSAATMKYVRAFKYCLKCDISKFYPSVDQDIMYDIVQRKIKCKDTLWLLKDIVYSFPGGKNVPIGNYTSQWFGNLYMHDLDLWSSTRIGVGGYVRYCDDFCYYSNDKSVLRDIKDLLPDLLWNTRRLTLSKCNLFPTSQGVDFLGYRHFDNYKLMRKSTIKRMKRRLAKVLEDVKGGADPEQYRSTIASAYGWLSWANSYNLALSMKLFYLMRITGIEDARN